MALLMGLGGGITRDVLINKVPGAITNPAYLILALAVRDPRLPPRVRSGQMFREGLFQFMTSFSLPLYAIVGAQAGVTAGLPIARRAVPGGRRPDRRPLVCRRHSGVPPKQFIRGEWFVTTALDRSDLADLRRDRARDLGVCRDRVRVRLHVPHARALQGWEEPLAREPKGVYQHDDGRPMLGRKIKGKSVRELRDLGLLVENGAHGAEVSEPAKARLFVTDQLRTAKELE